MSTHATEVGTGGVSPGGVDHGAGALRGSAGTVTADQSYNWSGYADTESGTKSVSGVTGSWVMPAVTCPTAPYQNSDAFLANWIGVDGFTNGTVEQLGSGAQCYEGVTYYYVWYEMYPANTVEEGTTACINDNVNCPQPGDRLTASIKVTPAGSGENNYTVSLVDLTHQDESFSTTQQCATDVCADANAEWIVERPATEIDNIIQILPAADFDRTYFTAGTVTSGGHPTDIQGFKDGPVYDIAMIDDTASYILACVDQPAPPGTLISATSATSCPTASPTRTGGFEESWDAGF